MSLPVVALIGRPNVGKSSLFNRIVGNDSAIVSEEAGTTRDRHFTRAEWNGRAFWLVDTGGLREDSSLPMDLEIRRQVLEAIARSSVESFFSLNSVRAVAERPALRSPLMLRMLASNDRRQEVRGLVASI